MAFTTCNASDFATYGPCYSESALGPKKQLAMLLLAMVAAYDKANAATEQTDMTGALNDADSALCGLTDDQLISGLIAGMFAYSAASEPSAANKNIYTACITSVDDKRLWRAIVYWLCKLLHG